MKFLEFLNESIQKKDHSKIEAEIVDACKEFKVSVRAVELDEDMIAVHYNFGPDAPKGFLTDKNDIRPVIKEEVGAIIKENGLVVKSTLNSNSQENVGVLTFFTSPEKILIDVRKSLAEDKNIKVEKIIGNKFELESTYDGEIYHIVEDDTNVTIYERDVDQHTVSKKGKSAKIVADEILKMFKKWA